MVEGRLICLETGLKVRGQGLMKSLLLSMIKGSITGTELK